MKTVQSSAPDEDGAQDAHALPGASASSEPGAVWARLVDQVTGPVFRGVRNVVRSPIRLTLVAVILGVSLMFVAIMVGLSASVQQRLASASGQIGTGITITPAGSGFGSTSVQYLTSAQVKTVEGISGVSSLSEYIEMRDTSGTIKGSVSFPSGAGGFGGGRFGGSSNGTIPPSIEGMLPGQSPLTLASGVALTIKSGRNLSAADATSMVALTSQALATANNYTLGSAITLNGTIVKIVGLYTASDSFDNDTIIIPLQTAQKIYDINGVTRLVAYADSTADVNTVTSAISKALGSSVQVVSQAQIYTDTLNALHSAESTIQTTLLISMLTSALIIIFAVFLIVRERTQEIGLLRAIGASRWQIVSQFASETLALALTAAVAAIALIALFAGTIARQFIISSGGGTTGRPGGRIFTRGGGGSFSPPAGGFGGGFGGRFGSVANQTLSAGLTPTSVLLVIGLGVALALIASIIPVWYVARVRPADALRQAA